ncbi:PAC2 family protein [Candidatus Bathyarchaeota archaeon]|nr:PAC2 family protein [Candidatus Bathyarchaeota archaeon]
MKVPEKSSKRQKPSNSTMVIGLEGWVNAGKVSTFTAKYLVDKIGAKKFCEISADEFQDYMLYRPTVTVKDGLMQSYSPPKNEFYRSDATITSQPFIIMLGHEPHRNWSKYVDSVLKAAKKARVKLIFTCGGFLSDLPSQGQFMVSASTNDEGMIPELKKAGVELTNYSGPTSIYSEMMIKAKRKGISVISFWSPVPMYVSGIYPRGVYLILEKILQLTGIKLDLSDLKKRMETFEAEFQKELGRQPDMRELIEGFRERKTREKEPSYIF